MRKLMLLSLVALTTGISYAESITTLFARNNGGALGGAVYFDVTVGPLPLEIKAYDTNTAELVPFGWTVYAVVGNSAGNETNPGFWGAPVATGSGVGMGINNPSPVTLDNTFILDANTKYAMALVMGPEAGHDYTNGNGPNQNYSNANVALALGQATNVPFTGNVFSPRVWNGTIFYNKIPEPATVSLLVVGGLALLRRR